jgi:hypothetical protein
MLLHCSTLPYICLANHIPIAINCCSSDTLHSLWPISVTPLSACFWVYTMLWKVQWHLCCILFYSPWFPQDLWYATLTLLLVCHITEATSQWTVICPRYWISHTIVLKVVKRFHYILYIYIYIHTHTIIRGHVVAQLVEALRYKLEGRVFDSRSCYWNFHWHNISGRTMALGSTQPLTEMSSRNISWG